MPCLLRARVCESKVPQLVAKALRSVAVDSAAAMGLRAAKAALYFRANEDLEKLGLVSKFAFLIEVAVNEVSTLCYICVGKAGKVSSWACGLFPLNQVTS